MLLSCFALVSYFFFVARFTFSWPVFDGKTNLCVCQVFRSWKLIIVVGFAFSRPIFNGETNFYIFLLFLDLVS